jgi:hypothetical protein
VIEYLRLAFGTGLVLLPGLVLGRSLSEALAWTMAFVFGAWALVFAVHSNIRLAVIVLALALVGAIAFRRKVSDTLKVSDTRSTAYRQPRQVAGWRARRARRASAARP